MTRLVVDSGGQHHRRRRPRRQRGRDRRRARSCDQLAGLEQVGAALEDQLDRGELRRPTSSGSTSRPAHAVERLLERHRDELLDLGGRQPEARWSGPRPAAARTPGRRRPACRAAGPTPKTIIAAATATTRKRNFRLDATIQRIMAGASAPHSTDAVFGCRKLRRRRPSRPACPTGGPAGQDAVSPSMRSTSIGARTKVSGSGFGVGPGRARRRRRAARRTGSTRVARRRARRDRRRRDPERARPPRAVSVTRLRSVPSTVLDRGRRGARCLPSLGARRRTPRRSSGSDDQAGDDGIAGSCVRIVSMPPGLIASAASGSAASGARAGVGMQLVRSVARRARTARSAGTAPGTHEQAQQRRA